MKRRGKMQEEGGIRGGVGCHVVLTPCMFIHRQLPGSVMGGLSPAPHGWDIRIPCK